METDHWDALVETLGPRLYRYFCASFSTEVASDLVQETFARLMESSQSGTYDLSRASPAVYGFGIAKILRLKQMRELYQSRSHEASPDHSEIEDLKPAPDQEYMDREELQRLRRAIHRLPDIQRECILLSINRELSLADIAQLMDQPINTIKSHLHRAKTNLKELIHREDQT